jgi:hypothetical protein
MPEDVLFDVVRDALAVNNAALRKLLPKRASLEDVYMRVGAGAS